MGVQNQANAPVLPTGVPVANPKYGQATDNRNRTIPWEPGFRHEDASSVTVIQPVGGPLAGLVGDGSIGMVGNLVSPLDLTSQVGPLKVFVPLGATRMRIRVDQSIDIDEGECAVAISLGNALNAGAGFAFGPQAAGAGWFPISSFDKVVERPCAAMPFFYLTAIGNCNRVFLEFFTEGDK